MKPKQGTTALIFAVIALLFAGRDAAAAVDAGQVLTFNGECFVTAGEQRATLNRGDIVHVGDVIEVPEGTKLKLLMNDGSVLALAENSKVTITNYDVAAGGDKRDAQLLLDSGLLRAVVSTVSQPSKFEVKTATSVAAARSTDWFVEATLEETRISVLEGTVSVARRDDNIRKAGRPEKNLLLTSNYSSQIGSSAQPPKIVPWSPDEFKRLIDRTSVRFGWCQCVSDHTVVKAACLATPEKCAAACASATYSFVPNARQECAAFYAESLSLRARQR